MRTYEAGPVTAPPKRRYFYAKPTFEQWLHGQEESTHAVWVQAPGLEIYVRRALYELRGPRIHVDLANIGARKPGKGAFTRFLDQWEPVLGFCVEVVQKERFRDYLARRGYVTIQPPGYKSIDMHKPLPLSAEVYPRLYMPLVRE